MKLLLSLFLFLYSSKILEAQQNFPDWFINPVKYENTVIGFTYGESSPIIDAERMFCVYKKSEVIGLFEVLDQNELQLQNSDYYYYFDEDLYESIKGNLYKINEFFINPINNEIAAIFSENDKLKIENNFINADDLKTPNWVLSKETSWSEGGYYYGVGFYTASGSDSDAWKTSEERAIFNILMSVEVKVYGGQYDYMTNVLDSDIYMDYTGLAIHFEINNIVTVERWPNPKNSYYYTLVKIRHTDLKSKIKETLDE